MQQLIRDNFIDVCERLNLSHEDALDCNFADRDLTEVERDDLFFGIGYVRGLADAWDTTALQVVDEVANGTAKCSCCGQQSQTDDIGTVCTNCRRGMIEGGTQ